MSRPHIRERFLFLAATLGALLNCATTEAAAAGSLATPDDRDDGGISHFAGADAGAVPRRLQVPNGLGPQWLAGAFQNECAQLNYFDPVASIMYR